MFSSPGVKDGLTRRNGWAGHSPGLATQYSVPRQARLHACVLRRSSTMFSQGSRNWVASAIEEFHRSTVNRRSVKSSLVGNSQAEAVVLKVSEARRAAHSPAVIFSSAGALHSIGGDLTGKGA